MHEINVQMSLSSEAAYVRAAEKVRLVGHTPVRGRGRMAYPIILVVRRLTTEAEKQHLESTIRLADPDAKPVHPPASFVR